MEERATPRILNNEVFLLVALSVGAFAVFVFTKRVAAIEDQMGSRIAAIWYEKGERFINAGEAEKAIQAFRKARADEPNNQKYALALADGLASGNRDSEAQQLLLQLRESDPENAEINIYLARLASRRREIDDAVHYYKNALYGRWTGDRVDDRRRQLRTELIRFLLQHQERALASSELLILERDLPGAASSHVEVANLFLEAGDLQHAFKNYSEAVQLDSQNLEALTGAGETSFQMGNYAKAVPYLKAASEMEPESQKTQERMALAEKVLEGDPLAPHLSAPERQSRLLRAFELSSQRLESCLGHTGDGKASTEFQSLKAEVLAMQPKLNRRKQLPDFDTVRSAVGLIFRIQKEALARCGVPPVDDQALLLIGREHTGAQP